jgi:hypothetical protein
MGTGDAKKYFVRGSLHLVVPLIGYPPDAISAVLPPFFILLQVKVGANYRQFPISLLRNTTGCNERVPLHRQLQIDCLV